MPPLDRRVRVTRIERETDDAVSVSITPVDGGHWTYRAGQYLTHCFTINGVDVRRPYSISVAEGAREIAFACKRVEGGLVSNYLCDELAVGDEYAVRGPSGDFCLTQASGPLLFIAAGCGITPIMSLIETALTQDPERTITLIYANRDQNSIMFAKRLDALAGRYDNFKITHVLSQPQAGWSGARGRLDPARLASLVTLSSDIEAYLCGPQAMMDDVAGALRDLGLAASALHQEVFTPAAKAVHAHPTESQTLFFTRSDRSIEQAPGQSILDAALANGVALDFSCTVGGCAACKVRVSKGSTLMDEPNCLSDSERAAGYVLACSAYAVDAVEIDA